MFEASASMMPKFKALLEYMPVFPVYATVTNKCVFCTCLFMPHLKGGCKSVTYGSPIKAVRYLDNGDEEGIRIVVTKRVIRMIMMMNRMMRKMTVRTVVLLHCRKQEHLE